MTDTDTTVPASENGQDDAALRRLGAEHGAWLDAYRVLCRTPLLDDAALDRVANALNDLEEHIAGTPARTVDGLVVRLRALWAALDHTDTSLFRPPEADAGLTPRLVWGLLQDAGRLARRP